jgi:hypothetical protein
MNVKNRGGERLARVAKTKSFVMGNGERACLLVDEHGMPLYYPNLFITTQIRNRSLSASTSLNSAGHLCAFLQALPLAQQVSWVGGRSVYVLVQHPCVLEIGSPHVPLAKLPEKERSLTLMKCFTQRGC